MILVRHLPKAAIAVAGLAALAGAAAQQAPPATGDVVAENARAEAVLTSTCTACHDLGVLVSRPRAKEEWPVILKQMIGNGANLSEADFNLLSSYLARTYSPQN